MELVHCLSYLRTSYFRKQRVLRSRADNAQHSTVNPHVIVLYIISLSHSVLDLAEVPEASTKESAYDTNSL